MSDEKQIAALRREIRRAGGAALDIRCLTAAVLLLVAAFFTGVAGVHSWLGWWPIPVALLGTWAKAFEFRCERRSLRERLARLPHSEQESVLSSLRKDRLRDTRRLAEAFGRELNCPAELAPCAATDARGDEASPAGR